MRNIKEYSSNLCPYQISLNRPQRRIRYRWQIEKQAGL
jgi:hypothetical protein